MACLHAVIDNYSQRILAWTVAEKLDPMNTCHVLQHAANCLGNSVTQVYMDSGVENLNKNVDKLLEVGTLERVITQVDVSFSNSMIEAWWRVLEFVWLSINQLDSVITLRKLIEFYVIDHNQRMPHSAFDGRLLTRCTSDAARAFPTNWRRRDAKRRNGVWSKINASRALPAYAAEETLVRTSPHEA